MRVPTLLIVLLCLFAGCLETTPTDDAPTPACPGAPLGETRDVVLQDMVGGGRLGERASQAVPLAWTAPLPASTCVDAVEVTITWENTATSGGDLYVGLAGGGRTFTGHDQQQLLLDGRHTERLLVPVGASSLPPDALDELTVWIHTDWASASESGLPVTLQVQLHFG